MYKELNIQINHNWLHNIYTNNSDHTEFLNQDVTSINLLVMDDESETVQQYGRTDGVTLNSKKLHTHDTTLCNDEKIVMMLPMVI